MGLILVIEDSFTTRKVVCKIVKEAGHEPLQASDGREGLEMIRIPAQ